MVGGCHLSSSHPLKMKWKATEWRQTHTPQNCIFQPFVFHGITISKKRKFKTSFPHRHKFFIKFLFFSEINNTHSAWRGVGPPPADVRIFRALLLLWAPYPGVRSPLPFTSCLVLRCCDCSQVPPPRSCGWGADFVLYSCSNQLGTGVGNLFGCQMDVYPSKLAQRELWLITLLHYVK